MRSLRFLFALAPLLYTVNLFAQQDVGKQLRGQKWNQGTIIFTDGTSLSGSIRYNYGFGTLTFASGEDSQLLTPRSVEKFYFYDDSLRRRRDFYTLNYKLETDNYVRRYFFEILREYEDFVVVAKSVPIELIENEAYSYGPGPRMGADQGSTAMLTEFYQFETICFLNPKEDKLEAFAVSGRITIGPNGVARLHKKSQVVNPKLLKKYFSSAEIASMKRYAKKNKLDFRVKGELVRILNFGIKRKQTL